MKKSKIEVNLVINGSTRLFLTATDELSKAVLAEIARGNYEIHGVTGNFQLGHKSLVDSIVIEERQEDKTENNEE